MSEYKSEVKQIQASQRAVYDKISDLSNLQSIKERMADPNARAAIAGQVGEDKINQAMQYMENVTFDRDSISIGGLPVGNVCLKIINREEPKCVKFEGEGTPVPLNLWIQIVPNGDYACAIRVTLKADLNFFIKQMVGSKLQKGVDAIADMLARIPY